MAAREDTVADIFYYAKLAHAKGKMIVCVMQALDAIGHPYTPQLTEHLVDAARTAARHALRAIDRGAGSELAPMAMVLAYCQKQ
jgi:hypothetical protein